MKVTRYVIDEKGRAINSLHYPYLYTDETGRNGYEFRLPQNLWRKMDCYEAELIIGDSFLAYGGRSPRKYVFVSNFTPPMTKAALLRKERFLARFGTPVMKSKNPTWRYPLVLTSTNKDEER